jgi:hypothetical protein
MGREFELLKYAIYTNHILYFIIILIIIIKFKKHYEYFIF